MGADSQESTIVAAKLETFLSQDNDSDEAQCSLDLSSCNLDTLPLRCSSGGDAFASLQCLDLGHNSISSLPDSFCSSLAKLEELRLSGNDLLTLPESCADFSHLRVLTLDENNLSTIPECLCQLNSLKELNLMGNSLSGLPEGFGLHLSQLETLRLDDTDISELPDSFCSLASLKTLHISGTSLTRLPPAFGELQNLVTLDFSQSKLCELPPSFSQLSHLLYLDLSENQLVSIGDEFQSAACIEKLYVQKNWLVHVPDWFAQLPCIVELNFCCNRLECSFPTLSESAKLCELTCGGNSFRSLHSSIGNLVSMHTLHIGSQEREPERGSFRNGNVLSEFPEELCQLVQLKHLDATENYIAELPEDFGSLRNLTYLDLARDSLSYLPDSFTQLSSLEHLRLTKNVLESLPDDFGNLQSLCELYLDGNRLTELPASFSRLQKVSVLDMYDNDLATFPTCLNDMAAVTYLDVTENPFFQECNVELALSLGRHTFAAASSDVKAAGKNGTCNTYDAGMSAKVLEALGRHEVLWKSHGSTDPSRARAVQANRFSEMLQENKNRDSNGGAGSFASETVAVPTCGEEAEEDWDLEIQETEPSAGKLSSTRTYVVFESDVGIFSTVYAHPSEEEVSAQDQDWEPGDDSMPFNPLPPVMADHDSVSCNNDSAAKSMPIHSCAQVAMGPTPEQYVGGMDEFHPTALSFEDDDLAVRYATS
ncbi:erbin-like [Sycon ciliatum]|uniref:erbin-like n=1 Tax=Sycon ciliatum TaxID=27933 RepID=UPI0031F71B74